MPVGRERLLQAAPQATAGGARPGEIRDRLLATGSETVRVPVLLALLSSVLIGGSNFLAGSLTRHESAWRVIARSQALGLVALLVVAVLTGAVWSPPGYLVWGVATGVVRLLALGAFYRALAGGTMGVVAPLVSLCAVVPVLLDLATGATLTAAQLVGIALILVGITTAGLRPESPAGTPGRPAVPTAGPLLLTAAAALGFGLVLVLLARGSRVDPLMTLTTSVATMLGLLAVAGSITGVRRGLARRGPARSSLRAAAAVGGADVAAGLAYAHASTLGNASVVAVLASLHPVVVLLLARQVHRERLRRAQVVSVVTTLAGVVTLGIG